MEAIGTAIWVLIIRLPHRKDLENPMTSTQKNSWMDCPRSFSCQISSVILTDIILTDLDILECFLSKYTNYMHIQASGPELQGVYFGYTFHPDIKIPPPIPNKFYMLRYAQQVLLICYSMAASTVNMLQYGSVPSALQVLLVCYSRPPV